jgi:hypothetical protein
MLRSWVRQVFLQTRKIGLYPYIEQDILGKEKTTSTIPNIIIERGGEKWILN